MSTDNLIAAGKDISDPNAEIQTKEWYQWYCEIKVKKQRVEDENKKILDDIQRRENRFHSREGDYRSTIGNLQRELRVRLRQEDNAHENNKKVIQRLEHDLVKSIDNIPPIAEKLKKEQD